MGDSSFEIDAITSSRALHTARNDARIMALLDEMRQLHANKPSLLSSSDKSNQNNAREAYSSLHALAVKSLQIESIVQDTSGGVSISHLTSNYMSKEAAKYRPSKYGLQNALKKLLEEYVQTDGDKIDEFRMLESVRFYRVESTLPADAIAGCLQKLTNKNAGLHVFFNTYRNVYILTCRDEFKSIDDESLRKAIDAFQTRLAKNCKVTRTDHGKHTISLRLSPN